MLLTLLRATFFLFFFGDCIHTRWRKCRRSSSHLPFAVRTWRSRTRGQSCSPRRSTSARTSTSSFWTCCWKVSAERVSLQKTPDSFYFFLLLFFAFRFKTHFAISVFSPRFRVGRSCGVSGGGHCWHTVRPGGAYLPGGDRSSVRHLPGTPQRLGLVPARPLLLLRCPPLFQPPQRYCQGQKATFSSGLVAIVGVTAPWQIERQARLFFYRSKKCGVLVKTFRLFFFSFFSSPS